MAARIGLIKKGQKINPAPPSRAKGEYGTRELAAIEEFASFKVPSRYQHQEVTRAGEFLLKLCDDPNFAELYRTRPEVATSEELFPGLSDKEKQALISRNEGAIQIAVKGSRVSYPDSDLLVMKLLMSSRLSREFQSEMREAWESPNLGHTFLNWTKQLDLEVVPKDLYQSVKGIQATTLLPWTAAYYDATQGHVLSILGHAKTAKSVVMYNDQPLKGLTYHNGALSWHIEEGNPHSGLIFFDLNSAKNGDRSLQGKIIDAEGQESHFQGIELHLNQLMSAGPVSDDTFYGSYEVGGLNWDTCVINQLHLSPERLRIGPHELDTFEYKNGKLTWANKALEELSYGKLQFLFDPITGSCYFFGAAGAWKRDMKKRSNLVGHTEAQPDFKMQLQQELQLSDLAADGLYAMAKASLRRRSVPFYSEWQKTKLTSQVVNRTLLNTTKKILHNPNPLKTP